MLPKIILVKILLFGSRFRVVTAPPVPGKPGFWKCCFGGEGCGFPGSQSFADHGHRLNEQCNQYYSAMYIQPGPHHIPNRGGNYYFLTPPGYARSLPVLPVAVYQIPYGSHFTLPVAPAQSNALSAQTNQVSSSQLLLPSDNEVKVSLYPEVDSTAQTVRGSTVPSRAEGASTSTPLMDSVSSAELPSSTIMPSITLPDINSRESHSAEITRQPSLHPLSRHPSLPESIEPLIALPPTTPLSDLVSRESHTSDQNRKASSSLSQYQHPSLSGVEPVKEEADDDFDQRPLSHPVLSSDNSQHLAPGSDELHPFHWYNAGYESVHAGYDYMVGGRGDPVPSPILPAPVAPRPSSRRASSSSSSSAKIMNLSDIDDGEKKNYQDEDYANGFTRSGLPEVGLLMGSKSPKSSSEFILSSPTSSITALRPIQVVNEIELWQPEESPPSESERRPPFRHRSSSIASIPLHDEPTLLYSPQPDLKPVGDSPGPTDTYLSGMDRWAGYMEASRYHRPAASDGLRRGGDGERYHSLPGGSVSVDGGQLPNDDDSYEWVQRPMAETTPNHQKGGVESDKVDTRSNSPLALPLKQLWSSFMGLPLMEWNFGQHSDW